MKMKYVACFLLLSFTSIESARSDRYTNRYDNVNIGDVISNRRLLVPYIKCLLDQGRCSPEGRELKSHIREALENYCGKCTETQRKGTRQVIAHLINNERGLWKQLTDKYDPEYKYVRKYEVELRAVKS